jgi:hypothetical protein
MRAFGASSSGQGVFDPNYSPGPLGVRRKYLGRWI